MTLDEIRQKGLDALFRELGPIGMMRFLQQYEPGSGNYARERRKWVEKTTPDELRTLVSAKQAKKKRRKIGSRRMNDYHVNVFYSDDDACYVADIPDLSYCSAF